MEFVLHRVNSLDRLSRAVDAGEAGGAVQASMAAADRVGVTGTPAWLLDGRFLLPGVQPHDVVERIVARLRERPAPAGGS